MKLQSYLFWLGLATLSAICFSEADPRRLLQAKCNGQTYSPAQYSCLALPGGVQALCPSGAPCACLTPAAVAVGGAPYGCYNPAQYHCTGDDPQNGLVQGAGTSTAGACPGTSTPTDTPTASETPSPTAASTPSPTTTSTSSPTAASTPSPTDPPTASGTPSPTAASTPSPTTTFTPSPTAASTPSPTTASPPPPSATTTSTISPTTSTASPTDTPTGTPKGTRGPIYERAAEAVPESEPEPEAGPELVARARSSQIAPPAGQFRLQFGDNTDPTTPSGLERVRRTVILSMTPGTDTEIQVADTRPLPPGSTALRAQRFANLPDGINFPTGPPLWWQLTLYGDLAGTQFLGSFIPGDTLLTLPFTWTQTATVYTTGQYNLGPPPGGIGDGRIRAYRWQVGHADPRVQPVQNYGMLPAFDGLGYAFGGGAGGSNLVTRDVSDLDSQLQDIASQCDFNGQGWTDDYFQRPEPLMSSGDAPSGWALLGDCIKVAQGIKDAYLGNAYTQNALSVPWSQIQEGPGAGDYITNFAQSGTCNINLYSAGSLNGHPDATEPAVTFGRVSDMVVFIAKLFQTQFFEGFPWPGESFTIGQAFSKSNNVWITVSASGLPALPGAAGNAPVTGNFRQFSGK